MGALHPHRASLITVTNWSLTAPVSEAMSTTTTSERPRFFVVRGVHVEADDVASSAVRRSAWDLNGAEAHAMTAGRQVAVGFLARGEHPVQQCPVHHLP